jgi:outer membrane protein TolC
LNLKLAKIKLSQTLRTGAGQEFTLSTSPSYDEYKADLDKDLANALETRLEIQQALANIEVRETEVKLNTNSYTPTVTLEKSKVSLEQAKIALEQAKDKIVTEVNQNYLSLTDAFNRIKSSEQSLAASKENLRVVQLKYQANIAVNSEVIDAQNSLTQAQVNLESAIMDYQIARIKYAKSVGTDSAI